MIKKEYRLTKNRYFQYIYRKGEVRHSSHLTMVFAKTYLKPFKVGFSVSKKIGKSVIRSKIKRLMTESFNQIGPENFNPKYNYIFVAKLGIEKLKLMQIKTEMIKLISMAIDKEKK